MAESTLEIIEKLRQELVFKIQNLTKLSINDVTVDISLTSEGKESDIAIEARDLEWHLDRHMESAWYTTELPQSGSTTIFVE